MCCRSSTITAARCSRRSMSPRPKTPRPRSGCSTKAVHEVGISRTASSSTAGRRFDSHAFRQRPGSARRASQLRHLPAVPSGRARSRPITAPSIGGLSRAARAGGGRPRSTSSNCSRRCSRWSTSATTTARSARLPEKRLAGRLSERRVSQSDLEHAFFVETTAKSDPKTGEVRLPNGSFRVPSIGPRRTCAADFATTPSSTSRAVLVTKDGREIELKPFTRKPLSCAQASQSRSAARANCKSWSTSGRA